MRTIHDRNVCVAGGAGFLGSHLVNHLIDDRGCRVLVLDNLCAGRLEFIHPKAEFMHCDITKSESVMHDAMRRFVCSFAFNFAAWPYIPDSFARPLHVFDVNANGAMMFINAAQEAGCEAVLQVSSAEIYGGGSFGQQVQTGSETYGSDTNMGRINETALVVPHSTYGVAKAAVDSYVQTAWKERGTPAIALRQFNCVGERETHPYIVPEIIGQLAQQQVVDHDAAYKGLPKYRGPINNPGVVVLGNNSFRDFLYAGDQARIAVELLERGRLGEVYNLGSETGIKMYDLAELIGKVMGFADVQVVEDESRKRPWEIWWLQSCNDKLRSALKQETLPLRGSMTDLVSLEEALRRTVRWYESNGRRWPWEK